MNKKEKISVFMDENATYYFIVGTSDEKEAEKALREQENEWYGEDESTWEELLEKRKDFSEFWSTKIYIRGEKIYWEREMIPKEKGRIAVRDGFMANVD